MNINTEQRGIDFEIVEMTIDQTLNVSKLDSTLEWEALRFFCL